MPYNLKRALEEKGGLPEGWSSVKVTDKRAFKFNSGTDGIEYNVVTKDKVKGKISFALTDAAFWRLGLFAKATGLSEHTLDKFELGDVIGKYVDVLMAPGRNGYLEAKAFAPFGEGGANGEKPGLEAAKVEPPAPVPLVHDEEVPF